MRLLSQDHLDALRDRSTWLDNPFVRREAFRDARRKYPAKSFAWLLISLSLLGGGATWLLLLFQERGHGVPWFLGGTFGTAVAAMVCGLHGWFVAGASRKHASFMLAQEANRNTLPSLLMLPATPFQTLLQAAVYPWLAGMTMALAGLPLYVLCLAAGGLTWADLCMLYLVFALMAVAIPNWSFPALSGRLSFVAPAQAGVPPAAAQTQAGAQPAAGNTAATSGGGAPAGIFLPFFMLAVFMPLFSRGGGLGTLYASLSRYIPEPVLTLLPMAFIGWPLVAARALVTPFDWFGIPLPPLPFVLASFLTGRYLQAVRSSEYLGVGTFRDLLSRPTYLARRRAEGLMRFGQLLALTGYLWKWAVWDGGLGFLVRRGEGGALPGLAGLVFILLFSAALRTSARARALAIWQRGPTPKQREEPLPYDVRLLRLNAWRYAFMPYGTAAVFYAACCLLSRTNPLLPAIAALGGKMLAIGIAGAVLQYTIRHAAPALTALGFLIALIVIFGDKAFGPLAVFSPLLGLLRLANPNVILQTLMGVTPPAGLVAFLRSDVPWWAWPLACGATAILALLWRRPAPHTALEPARSGGEETPALDRVVIDSTLVGNEVYMDTVLDRSEKTAREETPAAARVIEVVRRFTDNAVAIKELRARLRGKLSPRTLRISAVFFAVASITLLAVPAVSTGFGGGLGRLLFGVPANPAEQVAGSVLACWYFIMLWLSLSVGTGILPYVFAPEREKSTLGFLLLTPMRASAIVTGKLLGMLLSSAWGLTLLTAGTLFMTVVVSPAIGIGAGLRAWAEVVVTCAAVVIAAAGFSIALAALFPRRISQVGCAALLNMVFMQVPIQIFVQASRPWRNGSTGLEFPMDGYVVWAIFLLVCLAAFAIGLLLAIWGVKRMRKGDIAFEASKQEN
jgi:hypothetical protein